MKFQSVPILRSVTGTLRIAAGLLTPGIRANSCESKTLTPFSPPRWLLHHLIKINHPQAEAEAHDFDKLAIFGCMKVQTMSGPIGYPRIYVTFRQGARISFHYPVTLTGTLQYTYGDEDANRRPRFKLKKKRKGVSIMQILVCSILYEHIHSQRDAEHHISS